MLILGILIGLAFGLVLGFIGALVLAAWADEREAEFRRGKRSTR